jgi:hypothetical protein
MIELRGVLDVPEGDAGGGTPWREVAAPQGTRCWRSAAGEVSIRCGRGYDLAVFPEGVVVHDGRVSGWQDDPLRWNGSFLALALARSPAEGLVAYTDRLGTVPLYVGRIGRRVCFASRLTDLKREGFLRPDFTGAWQLALLGQPLWERTLLEGVALQPPAARIVLRTGAAPESVAWWQPPANPDRGAAGAGAVEELIAQLRAAHQRCLGAGAAPRLLLPVTGGLDSRINLALHRDALPGAGIFHVARVGAREGAIATHIARILGQPLTVVQERAAVTRLEEIDPGRETGELDLAQWWIEAAHATLGARFEGATVVDGYMQDVLFNPLIATADEEPAHMAREIARAQYLYRFFGAPPDTLHDLIESFRAEYDAAPSSCALDASQRYYLHNRSRRHVFGMARLFQNHLRVALPGIDSALLDFGFALPWGARHGAVLYRQAIATLAPDLGALPYDKSGLPLRARRRRSLRLGAQSLVEPYLDRLWPSRALWPSPDTAVLRALRRSARLAQAVGERLRSSAWVVEMLGGEDRVAGLVGEVLDGRVPVALVSPLLTVAMLDAHGASPRPEPAVLR